MSANGDGNGNHGDGEPRMPLDRLARFVSEQNVDIIEAFKAINRRLDLQQTQLEQLQALLLGRPGESGGEDQGNVLQ